VQIRRELSNSGKAPNETRRYFRMWPISEMGRDDPAAIAGTWRHVMHKNILATTAALLLGVSGHALAESAHPQSSTSGTSSANKPSTAPPTTSFPTSGAAGGQPQSGASSGTSNPTSEPRMKKRPDHRR
jgi:hypothetical protein